MKVYLIAMFILFLFETFQRVMCPDRRLDDWQQIVGIIFFAGLSIWTGCLLFI